MYLCDEFHFSIEIVMAEEKQEYFNERWVYTLSQVGKSLEAVVAKNYSSAYYIKAEVIKLNLYPRNGHCYPELVEKENGVVKAQMRGIIWASNLRPINERFQKITGEPLKEGITILCLATIEYDVKYGLALHIQDIEPSYTLGEMARNKAQTIERLKQEGVFDANKLVPMPLLPKRLAIISIETSKGYSDFMITLQQNKYGYKFSYRLFPSLLQGEKAVHTMIAQLDEIEKCKSEFDCVVILRGGGGDVGLSCYDTYELAHRVATFPLPIISGIGHSTNVTVTEMVSHENKITPTEVAYFFIQQFQNFEAQILQWQQIVGMYGSNLLKDERMRLMQIENMRQQLAAKVLITKRGEVENCERLLPILSKQLLARENEKLASMQNSIKLLHPNNILKRGFSITYLNGKPVTDAKKLKSGDEVVTQLHSGKVKSVVN